MANESLQRVDNWNDLTPPEGETENEEDSTQETVESTLPERSEVNTPPIAEDDSFGVRPGGSALLPVIDNDNDPDGDVLVAAMPPQQPSIGTVQPIFNGGSLQIAVAEDATGSATFEYEVDDGRGGKDTASVTLEVHEEDVNAAPTPKRKTSLTVETGGTVSYNILPDWIDPDGDDIYLKEVVAAPGDEVDFRTDGQLTYKATASLQGRKDVQVTVSDGLGELTTATIALEVRPLGTTEPVTNADHVVARVGEQITVAPLANDTSSGREPLRLARVDEVAGATITPDFANKTFSFRLRRAGHLLRAVPRRGGTERRAGTRARRRAAGRESTARRSRCATSRCCRAAARCSSTCSTTTPTRQAASSSCSRSTVDPTAASRWRCSTTRRSASATSPRSDEQVASPTASRTARSAEGEVVVIPVPRPAAASAGANDDTAVVRAGDVVTIPVLDNDYHPTATRSTSPRTWSPPLAETEEGETSSRRTRCASARAPRRGRCSDLRGDRQHRPARRRLRHDPGAPVNEETNTAPRPRDLTSRVLSGSTVRIAVLLDGIDPDGDSVELVGIASAPSKGRIAEIGANFLVYEAVDDTIGVDTFTYRVRDRLGKEATATIRSASPRGGGEPGAVRGEGLRRHAPRPRGRGAGAVERLRPGRRSDHPRSRTARAARRRRGLGAGRRQPGRRHLAGRAGRDLAAVHDPRRPGRDGHRRAPGARSTRTCRCSVRSPATTGCARGRRRRHRRRRGAGQRRGPRRDDRPRRRQAARATLPGPTARCG